VHCVQSQLLLLPEPLVRTSRNQILQVVSKLIFFHMKLSAFDSTRLARRKRIRQFLIEQGDINFQPDYFDKKGRRKMIKNRFKKMERHIDGFDLDHEVVVETLFPDTGVKLFQFIRHPSLHEPDPRLGQWFCRFKYVTMNELGIFSGAAGRTQYRFEAVYPINVLIGIARGLPLDLDNSETVTAYNFEYGIGGQGGGEQIYIPRRSLLGLRSV